jgi:hypothetical protein
MICFFHNRSFSVHRSALEGLRAVDIYLMIFLILNSSEQRLSPMAKFK